MSKSTVLANAQLDAEFNSTAFSITGDPLISLHTGDPGITGANEVAGGSYARDATAFAAAASKSVTNTAAAIFTNMPAAVVTHVGVWSAAGVFLRGGELTSSLTVFLGGTVTLGIGEITATEA